MSIEGVFIYILFFLGVFGFVLSWISLHFLRMTVDRLNERLDKHEYWNDNKEKNHVRPYQVEFLENRVKRLEDRK